MTTDITKNRVNFPRSTDKGFSWRYSLSNWAAMLAAAEMETASNTALTTADWRIGNIRGNAARYQFDQP